MRFYSSKSVFFLVLFCLFAGASDAANKGYAVAGSFKSLANAESMAASMEEWLRNSGVPGEVEIEVSTGTVKQLNRVVILPGEGISARSVISLLKQRGYSGAWFLPSSQMMEFRSKSIEQSPKVKEGVYETPIELASGLVSVDKDLEPSIKGSKTPDNVMPEIAQDKKTLIDRQDGIPRHQISVQNFLESEVDIKLDGNVDESIWRSVEPHDNMLVAVPGTGVPAGYKTEYRLIATEKGLYVGVIMYQPPETLVRRMAGRDQSIDVDNFGITLDVSGEGLVGYWFMVNLGDSMMDGKVLPERNYKMDWDGPWTGKSFVRSDGWSGEMFLPWSMMNVPSVEGPRNIGFAASRQVSHTAERYQWPGYSYSSARFVTALNQMKVEGVEPRQQISVIPFASVTHDQAIEDDEVKIGADVMWKPSPSFQVSATVNPDFGAVEVDDVILNLTAMETYFPEKRLFFLEGSEVFDVLPRSNMGYIMKTLTNDDWSRRSRRVYSRDFMPSPISLINTRRIGGTASQVSLDEGVSPFRGQRDVPTDLLGAAKLTGQIGDVRYGLLSAFEDDVEWIGRTASGSEVDIVGPGRDFASARMVYENIGENRKSFGYLGTLVQGPLYDAEVHSLDAHFVNSQGRLTVDGQFIYGGRDQQEGYGALIDMTYAKSPVLSHVIEIDYMDEEIDFNDLGFLARNNYARLRYVMAFNKQNMGPTLSNYRTTLIAEQQYNLNDGLVTDSGLYWRSSIFLPQRQTLRMGLGYMPERFEDIDSRGNGSYQVDDRFWADLVLATDSGKIASYSIGMGVLQEHLDDWTVNAKAGITFRPVDWMSLDFDLDYRQRNGWLVYQGARNFGAYTGSEWQPKMALNWYISPSHQIKLSFQWLGVKANEEGFYAVPEGGGVLVSADRILDNHDFTVSRLTAQVRYRWEIAPLTDLFIVYNRGNQLPSQVGSNFESLLTDSFSDPVIDSFIAKLRYRFGN
ncbi:DUF5916 domain-containing protein [Gammaproteobacteria bacterium]|nr:DUF5916 domain-containing protein [Gammaproteobacteria bacterium]